MIWRVTATGYPFKNKMTAIVLAHDHGIQHGAARDAR